MILGVILYFDDTSLREFVFLDPLWVCTFLCVALMSNSITVKNGQLSNKKKKFNNTLKTLSQNALYESSIFEVEQMCVLLKFAFRQFGAISQITYGGDTTYAVKFCLFQTCFLNLLSKFELSLPFMNKMLMLPSFLPNEYLLRTDYHGAKVKVNN